VQKAINRIQPFENVETGINNARSAGFTSINFDLIYGLPFQTPESMERTINQVITAKPDRIAFYSYAHVPWTSKAQRLFDETNLPDAEEKMHLYLKGKEMLLANGYFDIGMDHFALPTDDLYKAYMKGKLHRNFMGYTTQNAGLLVGLGVSSISDAGYAFAQNHKTLHDYYAAINAGKLAIYRGYELTDEDISFRNYILDISCRGISFFQKKDMELLHLYVFPELEILAADGLIEWNETFVALTEKGRYFIRNICAAFDIKLHQDASSKQIFSKAI